MIFTRRKVKKHYKINFGIFLQGEYSRYQVFGKYSSIRWIVELGNLFYFYGTHLVRTYVCSTTTFYTE